MREKQQEEVVLVDFGADVAKEQYYNNRYFLIENPLRSALWKLESIQEVLNLPGVWSVTLDAGAFGAEVDGEPIAKPMRWIGNQPGVDEALGRRLTPLQRQYCTPIEGKLTRPSQEYPDELCHVILQELRATIFQRQPLRFGPPLHQVLPVAYPTTDLDLWDNISKYVTETYEKSAKRPFDIPVDSEMGKKVAELFRINPIKIQVAYTPTSRRLPPNVLDFTTRASFIQYSDETRAVEVEDLDQIQFPRQRFSKAVHFGIFAYGTRQKATQPQVLQEQPDRPIVPGLSTDISFPQVQDVDQHVKRAIARLHLNLGHPSSQELMRLLAYQGKIPAKVIKAVQGLQCATCERLKPPQEPRPSAMPSLVAGQFGDEVQADVFYARLINGDSFPVLGVIDRATGLHAAMLMPDRNADTAFKLLEEAWLRPYGLPLKFVCDPDHTFRGNFEQRLQSMGCLVEHCPPEAHYVIGMIERRNAILRITVERLVDQFAVVSLQDVPTILIAACHASNQMAYSRGRSAYQAVFGRVPRLADDVLTDENVLSSSTQTYKDRDNPGLRAELVRSEAMKCLLDLNAQQQFRRALLRRTRGSHVPDLQPGQRCAVWRWTKKGIRKRGAWLMARFLSWDPSYVGKQAWVRLGASTTLVTSEQLRAAHGYEDWCPDEKDIKALKDASVDFGKYMLEDERGPAPEFEDKHPEIQLDDLEYDPAPPMTPAMMAPATPAAIQQIPPPAVETQTHVENTNVQVLVDSPRYSQTITNIQQRFGDLPKHLTSTKSSRPHPYGASSRKPLTAPKQKQITDQPGDVRNPLATIAASSNSPPVPPAAQFHQSEPAQSILEEPEQALTPAADTALQTLVEDTPPPTATDPPSASTAEQQPQSNNISAEPMQDQADVPPANEGLPSLPQKRP